MKDNFLVFHISYECDEECIFCSEGWRLKQFWGKFINLSTIKKVLEEKYKEGYRKVHFTGGEAFLHPNILEILKFSYDLGYYNYILTNGSFLSKEDNFLSVIDYIYGMDFSIHGSNEKTCYELTKLKNNYENIKNLLSLFKKHNNLIKDKEIFIDTVILNKNIDELENIYNFITYYFKPSFLLFSYLGPEGDAVYNYNENRVEYPYFKEKFEKFYYNHINDGIPKVIGGVPICELGENLKELSNDKFFSPRTTVELDKKDVNTGEYFVREVFTKKPKRNRKYLEKCKGCKYKKICGGYPILYKRKGYETD